MILEQGNFSWPGARGEEGCMLEVLPPYWEAPWRRIWGLVRGSRSRTHPQHLPAGLTQGFNKYLVSFCCLLMPRGDEDLDPEGSRWLVQPHEPCLFFSTFSSFSGLSPPTSRPMVGLPIAQVLGGGGIFTHDYYSDTEAQQQRFAPAPPKRIGGIGEQGAESFRLGWVGCLELPQAH